jgi:hypothetical protein
LFIFPCRQLIIKRGSSAAERQSVELLLEPQECGLGGARPTFSTGERIGEWDLGRLGKILTWSGLGVGGENTELFKTSNEALPSATIIVGRLGVLSEFALTRDDLFTGRSYQIRCEMQRTFTREHGSVGSGGTSEHGDDVRWSSIAERVVRGKKRHENYPETHQCFTNRIYHECSSEVE